MASQNEVSIKVSSAPKLQEKHREADAVQPICSVDQTFDECFRLRYRPESLGGTIRKVQG